MVGPTRVSESLRGGWTKPPGWGLKALSWMCVRDARSLQQSGAAAEWRRGRRCVRTTGRKGRWKETGTMQGCREGEKKKGEMEGNRQGGEKIGGKKQKDKNPVIRHSNPQERNSATDRGHLETGRPHKPKDMMENRAMPGKIDTERQKPWGKDGVQRMGFPGAQDMRRGSARTELETNGDLRCRQIERHVASGSNTGKGSARPKAAGSDSWWPRGPEPRQAPLSVGGILQAGTLGRVAAPSSRGILPAQESKPSLRHRQPGSSPPEPPAKHNRETPLGYGWARPRLLPQTQLHNRVFSLECGFVGDRARHLGSF